MGGGAERSSSSAASEGWGIDESLAESFGFSRGDSRSRQDQRSYVYQPQGDALQSLWTKAASAADPDMAQRRAGRLSRTYSPGMERDFTRLGRMANPNLQIRQESRALERGLGHMFRTQINPAIEGEAIAAGGFGGGRQGVAQGVAAGELADAFTQGRAEIVGRANQTAQGAAALRSDLAQKGYQLGMAPTMAALQPLMAYGDILGGPTVLNRSTGRSVSKDRSGNASVARSRGYNEYGSTSRSEAVGARFNLL